MGRIIINNNSDATDQQALEMVVKVIGMGRISNSDKQYCYVGGFEIHDATGVRKYNVISSLNKASDSFTIVNEKESE